MVLLKQRITVTVDEELIKLIDSEVDGQLIKNRSHAVELCIRQQVKTLEELHL